MSNLLMEVADRLSLAPETVYRMIRRGDLSHVRAVGRRAIRVPEGAVEAIIAGRGPKKGEAQ